MTLGNLAAPFVIGLAVGLMLVVGVAVMGDALSPIKGAVCILALGGVCYLAEKVGG
ncbi:MAG: hypothetical protein ACREN7_00040 [Candidatus Dormibacteria bacterium]